MSVFWSVHTINQSFPFTNLEYILCKQICTNTFATTNTPLSGPGSGRHVGLVMARVPVLRMLVTPINSLAKDLGLLWNDVITPNFSRKPKLKCKFDRHFLKHSYLHVNILYDIQPPYLLYKPMVLHLESQSDHLPKRLPRPLSSCTEPWVANCQTMHLCHEVLKIDEICLLNSTSSKLFPESAMAIFLLYVKHTFCYSTSPSTVG